MFCRILTKFELSGRILCKIPQYQVQQKSVSGSRVETYGQKHGGTGTIGAFHHLPKRS